MKAKIDEKSITFKMTEDEMNLLLANFSLETKISIGPNNLCLAIDLHRKISDDCDLPLRFFPDKSISYLTLNTTPDEIRKLSDMGRNRQGLLMKMGDLDICLQVDIRSDNRPKRI